MKFPEEDLKKIFQSVREMRTTQTKKCPPFERLIKAFFAETSQEEKFRIIDHTTECHSCAWKFEAIREIHKGTREITAGWQNVSLSKEEVAKLKEVAKGRVRELKKERRRQLSWPWGRTLQTLYSRQLFRTISVAAGILVILVAGFFVFKSPLFLKKEGLRGKGEQEIQLIAPKGETSDLQIVFRWSPYSRALGYEVKLMDEELTNLWSSGKIKKTEVELPQDQFQRLEKGKTYYWKVIVYLSGGKTKESNLQDFKLR